MQASFFESPNGINKCNSVFEHVKRADDFIDFRSCIETTLCGVSNHLLAAENKGLHITLAVIANSYLLYTQYALLPKNGKPMYTRIIYSCYALSAIILTTYIICELSGVDKKYTTPLAYLSPALPYFCRFLINHLCIDINCIKEAILYEIDNHQHEGLEDVKTYLNSLKDESAHAEDKKQYREKFFSLYKISKIDPAVVHSISLNQYDNNRAQPYAPAIISNNTLPSNNPSLFTL